MATTFIPLNDLHPAQWHQERALGIGGSEAASLFNEGYGCSRRLLMEKRGVEPDYRRTREQELTLRRGNKLEDLVASEFSDETGLKIRKQPAKVSKTHPHARVNLDRQIVAVDAKHLYEITLRDGLSPLADILDNPGPGALECKTMNTIDFRKLAKDGLTHHNHYILQLQHALAVTGYRWGVFAILDTTTFELLWFAMVRNEALIAEILRRVELAWDLVEDTTQPLPAPLPDGDKRCRNCLHRRTCRGDEYLVKYAGADFATDYTELGDEEIVTLANDYLEAIQQADAAQEVVDAIKGRVKERMEAGKLAKVRVPDLIRFCLSQVAGRKTWDGTALNGEINALRKGEIPPLPSGLVGRLADGDPNALGALINAIADRIANCQKIGKPSTQFRTYSA